MGTTRRAALFGVAMNLAMAGSVWGVGPAAVTPAAAQPAGPAATISPATDHVDGMAVTISARGFTPGKLVGAVQCGPRSGPPPGGASHCQIPGFAVGIADAAGSVTLTVRLDAVLVLQEKIDLFPGEYWFTYAHDCRSHGGCKIRLASGPTEGVEVPLTYVPGSPLAGVVTVTPDSGVRDAQVLTVTASDYHPGVGLTAKQCVRRPEIGQNACEQRTSRLSVTRSDGTAVISYRVDAIFDIGWSHTEPVDCRLTDNCILLVYADGVHAGPSHQVPLRFDPEAPLTPTVVTAAPRDDLVHDQEVTVEGAGYTEGEFVAVNQCAPESDWSACTFLTGETIGPDGVLDLSARVRVRLHHTSTGLVDCRQVRCQLQVSPNGASSRLARVDLHFDPDGPGSVDAVADAGGPYEVVEGAMVTLDGRGSTGPGLDYSWSPAPRLIGSAQPQPILLGLDDGTEPFSLIVTSDGGSIDADETEVTTVNAAPSVGPIELATTPPGRGVQLSTALTDVGKADTHSAVVDWGDGLTSPATVEQAAGSAVVTAVHEYAEPGRYTVTVTVTDDDGGTAASEGSVVVGCTVVGTEGPDLLVGTAGDDVVCGFGGNDALVGLDGADHLLGGVGNDLLMGLAGDDLLIGGDGSDWAIGGTGRNRCAAELRFTCRRL